MNITFDPEKDASNLQKHGMSLSVAKLLDWDSALIWQDARHAYGENRMVALGPIVDRLYCAVYVDRGESRRIISLRKANQREFDYYEKAINSTD